MKKKLWLAVLCALVLALGLSFARAEQPRVLDRADLFTNDQEDQLNALILQFQQDTGMDFVIATVAEAHAGTPQQLADDLYDQGGYGLDAEHSGVLYLIDMSVRKPHISTTGEMIRYMNDARIENAHEYCWDQLHDGEYFEAAQRMIYAINYCVEQGYSSQTGDYSIRAPKALTMTEILISAAIGLVVMLIFGNSVKSGYELKGSTYDYDFRSNNVSKLGNTRDVYTHTTTTRMRKPDPPQTNGHSGGGGGTSVHTGSSGTSHGGGTGRGF